MFTDTARGTRYSSPLKALRYSKFAQIITVMAVTALVAGVGFIGWNAFGNRDQARADVPNFYWLPAGGEELSGVWMVRNSGSELPAPVQRQTVMIDAGRRLGDAYCLDINGDNREGTPMPSFKASFGAGLAERIENLAQIQWLVKNSISTQHSAWIDTQAAIWHFANGANPKNPTAQYEALVKAAQSNTVNTAPDLGITIDSSKAVVKDGLFGPFTANFVSQQAGTISVTGQNIVIDGIDKGLSASVTAGQAFYLKTGTQGVSVTIRASAQVLIQAGSVMLPNNANNQPLILVDTREKITSLAQTSLIITTPAVGINGKDGANGKDGVNGTNGKDGANGKDGVNGTNGKDGANGKDGVNGTNGKDGVNGTNGKDGANGANGTNGTNGKDGSIPGANPIPDHQTNSGGSSSGGGTSSSGGMSSGGSTSTSLTENRGLAKTGADSSALIAIMLLAGGAATLALGRRKK